MKMSDLTGQQHTPLLHMPNDTFALPRCNIGLELEIERAVQATQLEDRSIYWNVKEDGSLRDSGKEFVLRSPLYGQDLLNAITELDEFIQEKKAAIGDSYTTSTRTSLHVHVDIRDLATTSQLFSFVAIYTILERALFNYFNDERESNNFCVALYRCADVLPAYHNLLFPERNDQSMMELDSIRNKYAAFNTAAVFEFGSIEFRHAQAMYDTDRVVEWVNIIQSMKRKAMEGDLVYRDLMSDMSEQGGEEILRSLVGPELAEKLNYPYLQEDMFEGMRLIQPVHLAAQAKAHSERLIRKLRSV